MSKVKSPQDKKRLSLLNDKRNCYGENSKSSRKSIRNGKQRGQQELRRAVAEKLRAAIGNSEEVSADEVHERAIETEIMLTKLLFKKFPDTPLAIVLHEKKESKRDVSDQPDVYCSQLQERGENRLLRRLRMPGVITKSL